ncbi:hypothetical protein PCASD_09469 [Puccinia coronata f. sp. avenae]|uniref:Uncharacterized protein n=1 Tax=Puccinia coronata f. sp. avenae TaxID=200324 RepID=A0A2N5UK80_9BASI|nr:hypothetical protein PCASD_09469 [Puccinia coronata f. sp. avenae]
MIPSSNARCGTSEELESSLSNKDLNSNPPILSRSEGSFNVLNSVQPARDSITTRTLHQPLVRGSLSNEENLTQTTTQSKQFDESNARSNRTPTIPLSDVGFVQLGEHPPSTVSRNAKSPGVLNNVPPAQGSINTQTPLRPIIPSNDSIDAQTPPCSIIPSTEQKLAQTTTATTQVDKSNARDVFGALAEEASLLNNGLNLNLPVVSRNTESLNAQPNVPPTQHSITTQTLRRPLTPRSLSTEEKLAPTTIASELDQPGKKEALSKALVCSPKLSCREDQERLSSAMVLYVPQNINTPPNKQPPPSSHSFPSRASIPENLDFNRTKEFTSSNLVTGCHNNLIPIDPHEPPIIDFASDLPTHCSKPIGEAAPVTQPLVSETHQNSALVSKKKSASEIKQVLSVSVSPQDPEITHTLTTVPVSSNLSTLPSEIRSPHSPVELSSSISPANIKLPDSPVGQHTSQIPVNALASETKQVDSVSLLPLTSKVISTYNNSPPPQGPESEQLTRQPSGKEVASEAEQADRVSLTPRTPEINSPCYNPPTPTFTQELHSESSLEYLPTSQVDADSEPSSVSEFSVDSAFGSTDQRLESISPPPENPLCEPASAVEPLIPHDRGSTHSIAALELPFNPQKPTNASPGSTTPADPNSMPPIEATSSPTRKRTKQRLVIDDSDDESRPVSPVADVSLAGTAVPGANASPPVATSFTINIAADPEDEEGAANGSEIRDWPDPDGKITAAQIRPILKANKVHYKSADSKVILLAKYRLLFSDKKGNSPRYSLRQCPDRANQQTTEAPPSVDRNASVPPNNPAQPNLPRPETQPAANTPAIPLLDIDINGSPAMSIQPLLPTITQSDEAPRLTIPSIDMNGFPAISIQPLLPTIAQPNEVPPSASAILSARREASHEPVSNWASDVFMANADNVHSADANRDNVNVLSSPAIEALASSIHSLAQASNQASIGTLKVIAEAFTTFNRTIASLPLGNLANMNPSPSPINSRRHRPQPSSNHDMEVDPPTTRQQGKRNCEIQSFVRQHCATMFGRCARDESYAPPATEEEQRGWIKRSAGDSSDDESDNEPASYNVGSDMELDEDYDPDFPYPNGPGHSAASPQALKIIWRTMRKAGVKSFRPDLSKHMSAHPNRFLWDLARQAFMRVVRSGEYYPLTIEMCEQVDIQKCFATHVQGHIMRKYADNKKFTPEQLAARQKSKRKNTRLATLKRWRLEEVVLHPNLINLIPIVEQCCSDDETDDEADPSLLRPGAPMRASVLKLPWRSEKVERIMIALDQLKARRRNYSVQQPNTPPPRVRRRSQNPKISKMPHKEGLPVVFYDESWLNNLPTYKLQALNTKVDGPPLDFYVGLVEQII